MSKLKIKEGQIYICKRDDLEWWTEGKEYKVQTFGDGILYLTDDDGDNWYLPNDGLLNSVFKLKEQTFDLKKLTTAQHKITLDDLAQDALETTFTLTQVRDSIVKAYQLFDNDSQRLAFLKGYTQRQRLYGK